MGGGLSTGFACASLTSPSPDGAAPSKAGVAGCAFAGFAMVVLSRARASGKDGDAATTACGGVVAAGGGSMGLAAGAAAGLLVPAFVESVGNVDGSARCTGVRSMFAVLAGGAVTGCVL